MCLACGVFNTRTYIGTAFYFPPEWVQATPYHLIQQQFGSYDFYRTALDSTGAISADDSLLYRVNLSYENANSFRDFVKTDMVFFAPSFTWNISDKTQANLDIVYQHFDDTTDSGIPVVGRPASVPINRQISDSFNNSNIGDRTLVSANTKVVGRPSIG